MVLIAILNKADESPPFDTHSWLSDGRSVQVARARFRRCCFLIVIWVRGSALSDLACPCHLTTARAIALPSTRATAAPGRDNHHEYGDGSQGSMRRRIGNATTHPPEAGSTDHKNHMPAVHTAVSGARKSVDPGQALAATGPAEQALQTGLH
jgi:hypothetical protein